MLKHISNIVFLLALIAMSSLWTLGWTGQLPLPGTPQQQSVATAASAETTPQASRQDISAETVTYYAKVLAWFAGGLIALAGLQIWLLYKSGTSARSGLSTSDRQMSVLSTQHELEKVQHLTTALSARLAQFGSAKVGNGVKDKAINGFMGSAYVVRNPRPLIEQTAHFRGHRPLGNKKNLLPSRRPHNPMHPIP